ncbi:MAG: phosphate/phosphite/phosphonate ABC transporter substrate-binding protein [gamma proteobacterium symbiont of Taylorina sp.]|nr:phosphate/phosphite/phosphonate ABC transporter substrate-binding protein [gamma proteobacterium symbiont of Taylorina sp.]
MRLHRKPNYCSGGKATLLVLLILSLLLISCDSSDNIPIQQVDSSDRLSDNDLQLENKKIQSLRQENSKLPQHNNFYFGFDLRSSPQEDAAQYQPFLNYLESATGYQFKLHFTPLNGSTVDDLGQNKTQFAAMGADSFLKAQSLYGAKSLVRGLNLQGKAEYRSFFIVKPNSHILSIKDIKGHTLAFGNRNSTQGHLIPRIILSENGISLDDLSSYSYTGSHQNCAESVVSGQSDVCGLQDKLAKNLVTQGIVNIIHSSHYYPSSGIVVNQFVPADVIAKVKQALIDFKPQGEHHTGLYHWDKTEMPNGFIAAKESDYTELRQWSIRLGFLEKVH